MYYEKKSNKPEYFAIPFLAKYNPHFHAEAEIIVNMGQGALADIYINSKKYRIEEGDAILIMPGQVHTSSTLSNGLFFAFTFPAEYTPKLSKLFLTKHPENPVFTLDETGTRNIIMQFWDGHSWARYSNNPLVLPSLIIGYINVLMSRLLETVKFVDNDGDAELFTNITLYIIENYTEQISLKELAEIFKAPASLISRVFNSTAGTTLPSFLNWIRVSAASELLTSSNSNITTISSSVGFRTIRNFNRTFCEFYGMTPSQYRKKHQ